MDGFLRDSVKVWLFAFHLTHRGKRFCKVGRKNFFKFSFAPYNTEQGRIAKRSERKICGVLFGAPAQAQQSGLCGERTSDGMYELSRSSGSEGIVVREDEAGFGEGTPQQDHHKGENEQ